MSTIKCDFCGAANYDEVYKPIGTKRNNRVCICKDCGLVFSIHDDIPYSRKPTVSGDADWGNVRFCKGQRFDAIKHMLPTDAERVLDVGSSRGHFVKWYRAHNPEAYIIAVEPDERVIDDYADEFGVIVQKLEDVDLQPNNFDFVYCMQTLEHTDSASAMLKQIYNCLSPGGTLFLEVPNIEAFRYPLNIEESFIDKHNYHFSKGVLCNYMIGLGYDVKVNDDNLSVRVVAKKQEMTTYPAFVDTNPYLVMQEYAENIQRNRAELPAIVAKLNRIVQNQRVAFWGANTILDLLIKYGGFDLQSVKCLVDSYMAGLIQIHGVEIKTPEALRVYQPDVCVILARHSTGEIEKQARKFGIRNVIKFQDLL